MLQSLHLLIVSSFPKENCYYGSHTSNDYGCGSFSLIVQPSTVATMWVTYFEGCVEIFGRYWAISIVEKQKGPVRVQWCARRYHMVKFEDLTN
jgi:hypothetical protein